MFQFIRILALSLTLFSWVMGREFECLTRKGKSEASDIDAVPQNVEFDPSEPIAHKPWTLPNKYYNHHHLVELKVDPFTKDGLTVDGTFRVENGGSGVIEYLDHSRVGE